LRALIYLTALVGLGSLLFHTIGTRWRSGPTSSRSSSSLRSISGYPSRISSSWRHGCASP
jgi:hypothetical protein